MTNSLEAFIGEVSKHAHKKPERTLFSLGARGYYENAASDLLAFFMRPSAEHDLGPVFLKSFLECLPGTTPRELSCDHVAVQREVATSAGGRIDLEILGADWCLIIENKIYHDQNNPFSDYVAHAKQHSRPANFFAVLSPDGTCSAAGWVGVSYKEYCRVLKRQLDRLEAPAASKWHVFAHELILHLENELYSPIMNELQIAFVEKHPDEFAEALKLAADYRAFLVEYLRQSLKSAMPDHDFTTRDDRWAVRCYSNQWGERSNIALFRAADRAEYHYYVTIYLVDLPEGILRGAAGKFSAFEYWREGAWHAWKTRPGIESRDDAVRELCRIGLVLAELLKTPAVPIADAGLRRDSLAETGRT
jgi:hypothetical protein